MVFRDGQRQHQAAPGRKDKDALAGDGDRDVAVGERASAEICPDRSNGARRAPGRGAPPVENLRGPLMKDTRQCADSSSFAEKVTTR